MAGNNQNDLSEVIRGCCENEPRAQALLYKELYGLAMNITMRYSRDEDDAATIVTGGFVKMFCSIKSFDNTKGNIYGWVKKIIINVALDFLKIRQKFGQFERMDDTAELLSNSLQTDQLTAAELLELIRMLPATTQAVFNLYVIDGYTHKEIGAIIGISDGTSKWHLNHARKILRTQIMNNDTK